MDDIRTTRQLEFADIWLKRKWGILYLSPRFGKCRVACIILREYPPDCSILIAYPDGKIKKSWTDEFIKTGYVNPNVTFTTHLSLKKYVDKLFDIVIIDEIQLLSENQIIECSKLLERNKTVLGLTGTLSSSSRNRLWYALQLPVIATYTIEQAISEGVISDYEIEVVTVPLANIIYFPGKESEKKKFDKISYVINKLEREGKDTKFLRLKRMRLIQYSNAKIAKTREVIGKYKNDRILVFCGLIDVAEKLGIPFYHSKVAQDSAFADFREGRIDKLAVIRIGNSGVTYVPLHRVIINYTDSNPENLTQKINRAMSIEYATPDKKAMITIISTNEEAELAWIEKALSFFNPEKIKYI